MKFKLVYLLDDAGEFKSFQDAFKALYERVTKDIDEGNMNWQLLETAIWIEATNGKDYKRPYLFPEARDRACEEGWLKDGKLVI